MCVRLGAKRVVCKRFTVSKYQPLFIQSQHQFHSFLLVLLLKTELKTGLNAWFLAWMSKNEEKKVAITYYFKLNQHHFINF